MRNLTVKKSDGSEEELLKLGCKEEQWQMRDLIWKKSYGSEEELSEKVAAVTRLKLTKLKVE
eukprot:2037236-Rhodomonas_salina.1